MNACFRLGLGVTFSGILWLGINLGPSKLGSSWLSAGAVAAEAQAVEFTTADGVILAGQYWPGPRGGQSPAVLLLDGLGDNRDPEAIRAAAAALHTQGAACLAIDWRGQGRSLTVEPLFWDEPTNRRLVKGFSSSRTPDEIRFSEFRPGYSWMMMNDLAAARAFLERRHDAQECNIQQLVLVGRREGASLGQLWAATEWQRFRITGGFTSRLAAQSEGRDLFGFIWWDPEWEFDRVKIPWLDLMKQCTQKRTTFISLGYPQDDQAFARLESQARKAINQRGATLFQSSSRPAGTPAPEAWPLFVGRNFEQMRKAADAPLWEVRDFSGKRYAWVLKTGGVAVAKEEDERNLRLLPTDRLLPR